MSLERRFFALLLPLCLLPPSLTAQVPEANYNRFVQRATFAVLGSAAGVGATYLVRADGKGGALGMAVGAGLGAALAGRAAGDADPLGALAGATLGAAPLLLQDGLRHEDGQQVLVSFVGTSVLAAAAHGLFSPAERADGGGSEVRIRPRIGRLYAADGAGVVRILGNPLPLRLTDAPLVGVSLELAPAGLPLWVRFGAEGTSKARLEGRFREPCPFPESPCAVDLETSFVLISGDLAVPLPRPIEPVEPFASIGFGLRRLKVENPSYCWEGGICPAIVSWGPESYTDPALRLGGGLDLHVGSAVLSAEVLWLRSSLQPDDLLTRSRQARMDQDAFAAMMGLRVRGL